MTVGKMMVMTLVTFVGWPAAAWIRPARTEPAPGEEDVEEGGQGEVDGLLGHHQLQGGRLVAAGAVVQASAMPLVARPSRVTRISPTVMPATEATDPSRARAQGDRPGWSGRWRPGRPA